MTIMKAKKNIKPFIPLYFMMLPGMIYLIINNYIPMLGITVAFRTFNVKDGLFFSPWSGLSNFEYLFGSGEVLTVIRNTLLYNAAFIIVNLVVGVLLAIIISDVIHPHMKRLFQSSLLLPFMISMVVVSYIVFALLSQQNGMMNKTILPALGKEPMQWYNDTTWWPLILVVTNCWKSVGYSTLIYIAGISSIDPCLHEAAKLDGANRWKRIKNITLPGITPSIITMLLMHVGKIFFSDFSLFYQVPQNSGSLYSVTSTIDTYVYRALMSAGGIGRSAAAGLFQSFVGFTLVMFCNYIVRKVDEERAIF